VSSSESQAVAAARAQVGLVGLLIAFAALA